MWPAWLNMRFSTDWPTTKHTIPLTSSFPFTIRARHPRYMALRVVCATSLICFSWACLQGPAQKQVGPPPAAVGFQCLGGRQALEFITRQLFVLAFWCVGLVVTKGNVNWITP